MTTAAQIAGQVSSTVRQGTGTRGIPDAPSSTTAASAGTAFPNLLELFAAIFSDGSTQNPAEPNVQTDPAVEAGSNTDTKGSVAQTNDETGSVPADKSTRRKSAGGDAEAHTPSSVPFVIDTRPVPANSDASAGSDQNDSDGQSTTGNANNVIQAVDPSQSGQTAAPNIFNVNDSVGLVNSCSPDAQGNPSDPSVAEGRPQTGKSNTIEQKETGANLLEEIGALVSGGTKISPDDSMPAAASAALLHAARNSYSGTSDDKSASVVHTSGSFKSLQSVESKIESALRAAVTYDGVDSPNVNPGTPKQEMTSTADISLKSVNAATANPTVPVSVQQSTGSSPTDSPNAQTSADSQSAPAVQEAEQQKENSDTGKQSDPQNNSGSLDLAGRAAMDAYQSILGVRKSDATFGESLSSMNQSQPTADAGLNSLQVAQNIIRQVKVMALDGKTVVNVKLEPESLGSVVLRVVSQDGKISADFNVRTQDARAYLDASVPQMRQVLQSNGVTVSNVTVNLSSNQSNGKYQQNYQKKAQVKAFMGTETGSEESVRSFGYNTMEMMV